MFNDLPIGQLFSSGRRAPSHPGHIGGGHGSRPTDEFEREENRRARRDEVENLEEKVDRLSLVCEAMWELMRDVGYTTEHLQAKVQQLDASDGQVDMKRTRVPLDCACGAKVPIAAKTCVFCSLPAPVRPAFDAV